MWNIQILVTPDFPHFLHHMQLLWAWYLYAWIYKRSICKFLLVCLLRSVECLEILEYLVRFLAQWQLTAWILQVMTWMKKTFLAAIAQFWKSHGSQTTGAWLEKRTYMIFKTDYEFCIDHPQILLWFSVQDSKVEYVSTFVFGDKSETGVFSLLFCSGFPVS